MGIRQDSTPINPNDAKAHITGITVLPDQVIIDWLKGQMHGVLVETSYDGANWVKLDKDNRSPYEDTRKTKYISKPKPAIIAYAISTKTN
ncbi:MAG: hypothetical protein IPN94_15395 [Sphingobacteriales bacterium]|nr:hypothetical protein [Sphingobacteriales bacterium]